MIHTIKIELKPHLAEYLKGKFADDKGVVRLPRRLSLYHLICDLTAPQPASGYRRETGNVELYLPHLSHGKCIDRYNYLSRASVKAIEDTVSLMFKSEYIDYMTVCKLRHHINYKDSASMFLVRYGVESITVDALIKSHKRLRDDIKPGVKRKYCHKN